MGWDQGNDEKDEMKKQDGEVEWMNDDKCEQ